MITIGNLLKENRLKKGISIRDLEKNTKIRSEFIKRIESSDWANLPDYPIVSGFVKSLAKSLDIPVETAAAFLRRDYVPKKLSINPKPDISNGHFWTPRRTFLTSIGLVLLLVMSYLSFEYYKFVSPPALEIKKPENNQNIISSDIQIEGRTTTDAALTVNNQPVTVDQDGNFASVIKINSSTDRLIFRAVSRSGRVNQKEVFLNTDF